MKKLINNPAPAAPVTPVTPETPVEKATRRMIERLEAAGQDVLDCRKTVARRAAELSRDMDRLAKSATAGSLWSSATSQAKNVDDAIRDTEAAGKEFRGLMYVARSMDAVLPGVWAAAEAVEAKLNAAATEQAKG